MVKKDINIKTKLKKADDLDKLKDKPQVKTSKKVQSKSFTLRASDINALYDIQKKTNEIASSTIDLSKIVRGAIYIAAKQSPEKILQAIKDAEW